VLGINREEQKFPSHPQLESNPWTMPKQNMRRRPGQSKVRNLTSYGAFVELEEALTA